MAVTIAGSFLTSRAHGWAVYTADDDHAVGGGGTPAVWELLRVASAMRSELVERGVCASSSWMASDTPWGYRSAATERHAY
jgi:hypothetical protein